MEQKLFRFIRFGTVFLIILVFLFSNFVSYLPQVLRDNQLAESLKIKGAQATIVGDDMVIYYQHLTLFRFIHS